METGFDLGNTHTCWENDWRTKAACFDKGNKSGSVSHEEELNLENVDI